MDGWEDALSRFIAPWRRRGNVVAACACGSHVMGGATPRSDIDVPIVLAPGTRVRERGNRVIDGWLFGYFANPPEQFRQYMRQEHAHRRQATATMLVTGRVLFDDRGSLTALVREARRWLARPYPKLSSAERARAAYALWDLLDNLRDAAERADASFAHIYHHHLWAVFESYGQFLRAPTCSPHRLYGVLTDPATRAKYLLPPFPDRSFARRLARALREVEPTLMLGHAERLTRHVLDAMGGFELDGFRLRSPVSAASAKAS